jgi:hypothetical protein
MTGIAFSRRNRRRKLYLATLADLAGLKPAEHLRPKPEAPVFSKTDRHRQDAADYRQHGAP